MGIDHRSILRVNRGSRRIIQLIGKPAGVWLRFTPALSLIILLYLGGLILAFAQSLGYFPVLGLKEFSLKAYITLFQ